MVILGDSAVGKTSILDQFVNKHFNTWNKTTIGADFFFQEMRVGGTHVLMQIWDTAGQERFHSMGAGFYRDADACVLVYDVTNRQSFQKLEFWVHQFLNQRSPVDPESFPFVLLGNKVSFRLSEHFKRKLHYVMLIYV